MVLMAAAVVGREQWCLLPSLLEGSLVGRGGKAQGDGRAKGGARKSAGQPADRDRIYPRLRPARHVRRQGVRDERIRDLQPPRNQMAQFNSNGLTLRLHACTSGLLGELDVLKTSLS